MLARSLRLTLNGKIVAETPLLVPAFSTKVDPQIGRVIKMLEEHVTDPILVSAYDIHYRMAAKIDVPLVFGQMIFLDSGGYECSKDVDLGDVSRADYKPKKWNRELHREVLDSWPNNILTVCTSYDHPEERMSLGQQVALATELFSGRTNIFAEFLLKPETRTQSRVKRESIVSQLEALRDFDIIGITEKELGSSILERMETIAFIRLEMDKRNIVKPLHIFGSLDTVVTPLYFLSGADIFDGLTWLRYAFMDGVAVYEQDYGALQMPADCNMNLVRINRIVNNLAHLRHLRNHMQQYLYDGRFKHFKYHSKLFEDTHALLLSRINARRMEG